ncbi:MAG: Trk family potassium uptake protein [Chloroflexi bacterium]|nr:Trk family potassium uptake protein [Chloroflexota bacterium]
MRNVWRPRPGDTVVRRPRPVQLRPIILPLPLPRPPSRELASPSTIIYGFLLLALIGSGLLLLPWATTEGKSPPFMTAFFTAVSAVTVTGLVIEETGRYWNLLGQAIIMTLIFLGGLGWMTLASFMLAVLGQRISLSHQLIMREPLGVTQVGAIVRFMRFMVFVFLAVQATGALLLTWRFLERFPHLGWAGAAWQGLFQAISAFNNAGFSILPGAPSLEPLAHDLPTLGLMALLIMLGGLSYVVLADTVRCRLNLGRLALDTKVVLVWSLLLWGVGTLVIFGFEYGNSETLLSLPVVDKIADAFFLSVSARTAGFTAVDFSGMTQAIFFFVTALMFIGAASASAGGGIRVNTLGVVAATMVASFRGRSQVTLFGREVPEDQVHRALAISVLGLALVFLSAFALTFVESFFSQIPFLNLLFEVVSAFGTVGLSTGITPDLSLIGKLVIITVMLIGRVGPLVLALAIAERQETPLYRFAQERVRIG